MESFGSAGIIPECDDGYFLLGMRNLFFRYWEWG